MSDITQGDVDTVPARKKIANRLWLDGSGKEAAEENAVAVAYEFLGRDETPGDGKQFVHQISAPGTRQGMLEGFGALTLMGNITNTWLGDKGDRAATAHDAIADRWQLLDTGVWIDRTSAVGARVDKGQLAQAIVNVAARKGQTKDHAAVLAKLESEPELLKAARANPEFSAEYASLMGRTVKSVDDVLAAI